jgi:predicted cobalt transporter CbtA
VRLVELAEQRAKARGTQAADEHAPPAAASCQAPGAPDGGMAVHVGENDDEIRAFDDRSERFAAATVHVAGVALELVSVRGSEGLELSRGAIDSTNNCYFHWKALENR